MIANIIRQSGKALSVDYLVVAGGGSGGSGSTFNAGGGGGGAGGVLQGTIGVNVGDTYALTVGTGGATAAPFALGNNGTSSIFNTFTAVGGGAGASHTVQGQSPNNVAGSPGGSGGGGSGSTALGGTAGVGGAGTSGQGNNGGTAANNQPLNGGGGGGAGAAGGASATGTGARAGAGGAGIASNITGTPTYYGGGGGGGIYTYNNSNYLGALQGLGGVGGGGNGGANATATAHGSPGTPNTGGGGGGGNTRDPSGSPSGTNGGSGGSGIVILKCSSAYEIAEPSGLNYSSALSGGNRIYSFYSGTGNVTFQSATTDPYFSSVSLLLHMDGANGATTFVDSGPNALTVTPASATTSTTQSKFGGSSGYFDGSSSSALTIPASSVFNFGTGDFTIESWFNIPAGASGSPYGKTFVSNENNVWSAGAFSFYALASSTVFRPSFWINEFSSSVPILLPTGGDYRDGNWHHLAVVRSGSSFSMYIDGSLVASGTHAGNCGSSTRNLMIGDNLANNGGDRNFLGKLDDLRITKGVARYTSAFTPPTSAFPNS